MYFKKMAFGAASILVAVMLSCNLFAQQGTEKPIIAIFNTSQNEKRCYKQAIDILESNNFAVEYYYLSTIVDTPLNKIPLNKYRAAFFIICPEFLDSFAKGRAFMGGLALTGGLAPFSPVSKKILFLMNRFSYFPGKMIGLWFPSAINCRYDPMEKYSFLFENVGIDHRKILFRNFVNKFLMLPPESRFRSFETTLSPPQKSGVLFKGTVSPRGTVLLPRDKGPYLTHVKNLFPLGICWFNKNRNNHILVSNSSFLSFSGISENFRLCPTDKKIKENINFSLSNMMKDLHLILTKKQTNKSGGYKTLHKKMGRREKFLPQNSIAWMDLKNNKSENKKLIDFILTSRVDYLWITLNPHMYYSPIARYKNKKNEFFLKLAHFNHELKKESSARKIDPPKVLIGFEIVNNFYKPNLPKHVARDLYGREYFDVPAPLAKSFWENEVKMPLKKFLRDWKKRKISHGIKLAGVVLDLEMYGRQTTGSFSPIMGFEPDTIVKFLQKNYFRSIPINLFTQQLINKSMCKKYFRFLERQASKLASNLRQFIHKEIPNAIGERLPVIACYAPSISVDWFYKGFYKGLSTKKNRIYLLTFNTGFADHKKWLEQKGIQADHYSVLMLSKLTGVKSYEKFDRKYLENNGPWINKFSRFPEKYRPKHWSVLEQTKMSKQKRKEFAKHMAKFKINFSGNKK
jgi:hypothetical protein